MGHYCVYLLVGLLAVTFFQTGVMGNHAKEPGECCFKYYIRRIPLNKIDSYMETSVQCSKPGVIFVTQRGLRICVDPQMSWVNRTMQLIDERNI